MLPHRLQKVPHKLETRGPRWQQDAARTPGRSPWQRPQRAAADGPGNQALPGLAWARFWDSTASWRGEALEAMAAPELVPRAGRLDVGPRQGRGAWS